jgi:hypothetical protein
MSVQEKMMENNTEDIIINNMADIRKAIIPFMREVPEGKVEFASEVEWTEDGKNEKTKVSAYSTNVSVRQKLLEGLDGAKDYEKMWGDIHDALEDDEFGTSLPQPDIDKFNLPVDRLIRRRLGGKREGMTVTWDLGDKKVVFDPFEKTLREEDEKC